MFFTCKRVSKPVCTSWDFSAQPLTYFTSPLSPYASIKFDNHIMLGNALVGCL